MNDRGYLVWVSAATGFCAGLIGGTLAKGAEVTDLDFVAVENGDKTIELPKMIREIGQVVDQVKSLTA